MKEIKFAKWEDAPSYTQEELTRIACEFDEQCNTHRTGVRERWALNKTMINSEELSNQEAIVWNDKIKYNGV